MITNDTGKCEYDVETSDLLAAKSSGCATWPQKLNMYSLSQQSQVVAASIRLNDFVVDMSDSDTSDPNRCVLDARVNAALISCILEAQIRPFTYCFITY